MKYIKHIINEDKDAFINDVTKAIFGKISLYIESKKLEIKDDMFMPTIFEEDVDAYLDQLKSESIEYEIDGDIIIETTSKMVRRNKTGAGTKSRKLTRIIKPCKSGETRVGKRGCRKGTTGKSKQKARKMRRTKRKQVSRTSSGESKKRNKAIGKFKAKKTRRFNK